MQPNMEMTLCDSLRASEAYMTAVWIHCLALSFRPERGLWSRKRPKLGESARKPAASRPGGGVFQRIAADLSCRFRLVWAWIAVMRIAVALAIGGWRRGWRAPSGR